MLISLFVIFTIPVGVCYRLDDRDLLDFGKMAWATCQEVLGGDVMLAGVRSVQFWHSFKPLEGWFPHVHITLSRFGFKDGEVVELPKFVSVDVLNRLRVVWKAKFEKRFGVVNRKDFVVKYLYGSKTRGYKNLYKRLYYQYRKGGFDLHKAVVAGIEVNKNHRSWIEKLLIRSRFEKNTVWCGWLADGVKSRYLKLLDIVWRRKRDRIKKKKVIPCPVCGEDLHPSFVVHHNDVFGMEEIENGLVKVLKLNKVWRGVLA